MFKKGDRLRYTGAYRDCLSAYSKRLRDNLMFDDWASSEHERSYKAGKPNAIFYVSDGFACYIGDVELAYDPADAIEEDWS